jgi:hypothetical protein
MNERNRIYKRSLLGWKIMMKHKRNVEGLRRHARERHEQALGRTEEAIIRLSTAGQPVNFKAVAEAAQVSTAWLYGQVELRRRIESLRLRQISGPVARRDERASDSSKDSIIAALKLRVKSLEQKNQQLQLQLEIAYGELYALRLK